MREAQLRRQMDDERTAMMNERLALQAQLDRLKEVGGGYTRASLRSEKDRLNIEIYRGFIEIYGVFGTAGKP